LVVAISQACKVLGIHCIAKKVETQAALEWLEAVGCDFAQGFALEKPLSLETLSAPTPALPRKRGRAKN
jgi:EAL domain-containing protein (putative c-di-GMP-specific phosphodiesterase class I)